MINDSIADLVARINNAIRVGHSYVVVRKTKLTEAVLGALMRHGMLRYYRQGEDGRTLVVHLKYYGRRSENAIRSLRKVSKGSRRIYEKAPKQRFLVSGLSLMDSTKIYSTAFGVLHEEEARERQVGGEVLVEVNYR